MTADNLDLSEFKSNRLTAVLLISWNMHGCPFTVLSARKNTFPATDFQEEETKLILRFEECEEYELICNKSQARDFIALVGDESSSWAGKKITLNIGEATNPQTKSPVKTIKVTIYRDPADAGTSGPRPKPAAAPQRVPAAAAAVAEGTDPFAGE